MNNKLFVGYCILQLLLPIKKGIVFFRSFNGQYNDNPKYISEAVHKKYPYLKIVWAIKDDEETKFPCYVKTVKLMTKDYAKYIARAEFVIDNYSGCRSNFLENYNNIIKKIAFRIMSKKKKGQMNISTWHGTPLKHIGLDEPKYKKKTKAYLNTDMMIAGCNLTANAYRTAFNWQGDVFMYGTPRNDILFKDSSSEIKERLGLPKEKKVILFAPTFRNNIEMSGIYQLKHINVDKLLSGLNNKFGGDWCFVFRSHNLVMKVIEKNGIAKKYKIINGNEYSDMAEYLSCADILLTDYSSSMFDYALCKRPCFLYTPDLNEYSNTERGFYIDFYKMPFSYAKSFDELLKNIEEYNEEVYIRNVTGFLSDIGNIEDGKATERILGIIGEKL